MSIMNNTDGKNENVSVAEVCKQEATDTKAQGENPATESIAQIKRIMFELDIEKTQLKTRLNHARLMINELSSDYFEEQDDMFYLYGRHEATTKNEIALFALHDANGILDQMIGQLAELFDLKVKGA